MGSRVAARRAGIHDATAAIARKIATIAANVIGSVAFTPTSMLIITRVSPNDASAPARFLPHSAESPGRPSAGKRLLARRPRPCARRFPAVRCRTTVASTPYNPTPASNAAITANTPMSSREKRVPAWARFTSLSIGCSSVMTICGSILAIAARTASPYFAGSPVVRIAHCPAAPWPKNPSAK